MKPLGTLLQEAMVKGALLSGRRLNEEASKKLSVTVVEWLKDQLKRVDKSAITSMSVATTNPTGLAVEYEVDLVIAQDSGATLKLHIVQRLPVDGVLGKTSR